MGSYYLRTGIPTIQSRVIIQSFYEERMEPLPLSIVCRTTVENFKQVENSKREIKMEGEGGEMDDNEASGFPYTTEIGNSTKIDSKEEDSVGGITNPLDLPEIISNILEFLDMRALKKCRTVSRMWNKEACNLIRRKGLVSFTSITQVIKYLKVMENSEDLPHERFSFLSLRTLNLNQEDVMILNHFLLKFGPLTKSCNLTLNEEYCAPHDWWIYLYNMHNLEELCLNISGSFMSSIGPGFSGCTNFEVELIPVISYFEPDIPNAPPVPPLINPIVFEVINRRFADREPQSSRTGRRFVKLMKSNEENGTLVPRLSLPKLQRLIFSMDGTEGQPELILNFFKTLFSECSSSLRSISSTFFNTDIYLGNLLFSSLRESGLSFGNLRELNMWMKLKENEIKYLYQIPSLRRLKLILSEGIKKETFEKAISSSCPTLEILDLVVQGSYLGNSLTIGSRMPNLGVFRLIGYNGPLNFLRVMPSLVRLDLHDVKLGNLVNELMLSNNSFATLKSLKLTGVTPSFDTRAVCGSINCLAQLVSLEIDNCDDNVVELVYKTMPNLQDLKLSGTFTDEVLTGISTKNCQEIIELDAHFIVDEVKLRQFLFLGCLSELRTLSLTSDNMTDITIMFGLSKMRKLRSLTLSGDKITDRGLEAMRLYMFLDNLDLSGCTSLTEKATCILYDLWGMNFGKRAKFHFVSGFLEPVKPTQSQLMNFNHVVLQSASTIDRRARARFQQLYEEHNHFLQLQVQLRMNLDGHDEHVMNEIQDLGAELDDDFMQM